MKFEACELGLANPVMEDYCTNFSKVATRFFYPPSEPEVFVKRAHQCASFSQEQRERVGAVLLQYNQEVGNAPAALQNIERLYQENALVVVGGQQAGLLTGPLYTIYKAISILQLAKEWSQRLQQPVIPLFWIAGEDHDFLEVDHTYLLTKENRIERIRLPLEAEERTPISYRELEPNILEAYVEEFFDALLQTEFTSDLKQSCLKMAADSTNLTQFFARLLVHFFGSHGLILLDSAFPPLREVEIPLFTRIIEENEEVQAAFRAGSEAMKHLGYPCQIETMEQNGHLFYIEGNERELLTHEGGVWKGKHGTLEWTTSALRRLLLEDPTRFSNNVVTRPLMQEWLFPTLAFVAGPGEVAYWAMLKELFQWLGSPMPPVVPRFSGTVLEGTIQKLMRRYELTFPQVWRDFDQFKLDWLKGQDDDGILQQFQHLRTEVGALYQPLLEQLAKIHGGMEQLGVKNLQKVEEQIMFLQQRTFAELKRQHQTALHHFQRIENSLIPQGKPQERIFNLFQYLNKYGEDWLKELVTTPLPIGGVHHLIG